MTKPVGDKKAKKQKENTPLETIFRHFAQLCRKKFVKPAEM